MFAFVTDYLDRLGEKRAIDAPERKRIAANIDRLHDLVNYPFTALEISGSVDEEQVADIFVRINSEGVKLNQADFILTLMSVFQEEGRVALERFCRASRHPSATGPSPFNHFIAPDPDQLLRVAVAVGFHRARLRTVYNVLRGKDLETGQFSPELRDTQFGRLDEAQTRVLNFNNWHGFFHALIAAGFRGRELVSSQATLLYAYAFYLLGLTQFKVDQFHLQKLVGRYFFATSITSRYSSSPESTMEQDLSRLRELSQPEEFVRVLARIIDDSITSDFCTITLSNELETSSTRSPAMLAFHAAQNRLKAPVLFSDKLVPDLFDPALTSVKKPIDRHHLFPRGFLEKEGVRDIRHTNQVANLAFVEFKDNITISDKAPWQYLPAVRDRFKPDVYASMCEMNALPDGWDAMPYDEFLGVRRLRTASIVRRGFEDLA
jgi:hypothetical protein